MAVSGPAWGLLDGKNAVGVFIEMKRGFLYLEEDTLWARWDQ